MSLKKRNVSGTVRLSKQQCDQLPSPFNKEMVGRTGRLTFEWEPETYRSSTIFRRAIAGEGNVDVLSNLRCYAKFLEDSLGEKLAAVIVEFDDHVKILPQERWVGLGYENE